MASSLKQIAANRRNAQKSTGPRTPEGKARSAQNSLKHGLTAQLSSFSPEERAECEELRAELIRDYRPVGSQELMLVTQIAESFTRIRRRAAMENDFIANGMAEVESATHALTVFAVMRKNPHEMALLRRYETTANSVYFRSIHNLTRIQNLRHRRERLEAKVDENALRRRELARTDPRNQPQNGFVSHTAPQPGPEPVPAPEPPPATTTPGGVDVPSTPTPTSQNGFVSHPVSPAPAQSPAIEPEPARPEQPPC